MMKRAKSILTLIYSLVFSAFLLHAQSTGYELSNAVYSKFNNSQYRIRTQNLVNTSENQFPYNVYISFQGNSRQRGFSSKQMLLIFDQKQALKHPDLINTLLKSIQDSKYEFPVTVLFSYDDTPKVYKKDMVFGTKVYLNNSNINENTTALIFDLNSDKNSIITSSKGISSPSFLVKNALNLYSRNNIDASFPTYYVSQLNKYHFFVDNQLDFFFEQEIPAIKLAFTNQTSEQNIYSLTREFIQTYSENLDFIWDQHFIIVRIFNTYRRLTERNIVRLIITMFFMCILFIFLLGFVNSSIKNQTWKKIKKIWYSAPIIFTLIYISFFIGKGQYLLFAKSMTYTGKIIFLFVSQVLWSFILTFSYFVLQIKKGNNILSEKAIDFLILFTSSINLFIFSFLDISLFPIFLLAFIFAIFVLILNNRFFHIALFILMIIPYVPYVHTIFSSADLLLFQESYTSNYYFFILESLLLTPIILTYFRILTSFKNQLFNYKRLIITTSVSFVAFTIIFSTTGLIMSKYHSKNYIDKSPVVPEISKKTVSFVSWNDKKIFSDNVRTLKITIPENTIQCEVIIDTENSAPVLYSNSDYVMNTPTQASFIIPSEPEQILKFTYGFDESVSTITINTVHFDSSKGIYYSNTTKHNTGGSHE